MLELDEAQLSLAPSTDYHLLRPDPIPCACCSPVVSLLNNCMAVTDQELASIAHWQAKRPPLSPLPVGTQLFINAKVFTVDEDFSFAEALAIRDGKILAVGAEQTLRSEYQDAAIVDCAGRTILPGFIEPHMHFLPIATIGKFADVGPVTCPSIESALRKLRDIGASVAEGQWIMGRQIDPSLQDGAQDLNRHVLDTVSTTKPVFVYNASLHFAYCNTRALEIAGIDKDTQDDASSAFGREADGTPNGVLQGGKVMGRVIRHNPEQRNYDLAAACLDVCTKANRVGITTFCDQGTGLGRGVAELELYAALSRSERMTTRLRYSLSYVLQEKWDQLNVKYGDGNAMVRATAWKIVSDGSNQGLSGLQREPYLFTDGTSSSDYGVAYVGADELKAMVMDRAARGWPLAIHANGDKAIDIALDAFEAAFETGLLNNGPHRIEHCSILHDDQIDRIQTMGLSPSFLIGHVYYWGQAMRDSVFGQAKAELLDRTQACESKGIRWTLHSDEPVTEMGPLRCIENAVTRKMWREPETVLAEHECIDVAAAIRAMTRDAAWQCHSDHEVGSLEVGKFADFVVLDKDPMSVPVGEISDIKVCETWLGGRCVFKA